MNKQMTTQHVQTGLSTLYQAAEPDVGFTDRLEQQFQGQRESATTSLFTRQPRTRVMPVWATAMILVLVLTAVSVIAIGPQRVWAEVLGLISFIPGVGIAEVESTRLLVAPVTVRQEKVEFIVQSVAVSDRTVVKYSLRSLIPGITGQPTDPPINARGLSFHLELPDGSILQPDSRWMPSRASSYQLESALIFPRLPDDIMSVTLVLEVDPEETVLPIDPEGVRTDLALIPAADESLVEEFPEPQKLEGASVTQHGITMQVNSVFYTDDQIAVDVSLLNDASPWLLIGAMPKSLVDDTSRRYYGQVYDMSVTSTEPYHDPESRIDMVFVFEPGLREDATVLNFGIENVIVYTTTALSWDIDMGATLTLNKSVPMEIDFEIAGCHYQIVRARWLKRPDYDPYAQWWDPQDAETEYSLAVEVVRPTYSDSNVEPFSLAMESDHALYTTTTGEGEVRGNDVYHVYMLGFSDLPEDAVTISVPKAFFWLKDTWYLEWDVVHPDQ